MKHAERDHSKFSASGSERWLNCPASVALEEKCPPSPESFFAKEGTLMHEVLEAMLTGKPIPQSFDITPSHLAHMRNVVKQIKIIHKNAGGPLLVEKKVYASFIHPEMFGTCDVIIPAISKLHIIDFKFGAGKMVEAFENKQLLQYALSVAEKYDFNFDHVVMWILQPRAGKKWVKSWTITMKELETIWLPKWRLGVARVEKNNTAPVTGSWCHWCRAKSICPAKTEQRAEKVSSIFEDYPIERGRNEKEKSKTKSKKEKIFFEGEAESFGFEQDEEKEEIEACIYDEDFYKL